MQQIIEIQQVSKLFHDKQVLKNVDLSVRRGETRVIIGQSGCGKSVLLKLIIGLLEQDSGRILVDGTDIHTLTPKKQNVFRSKFGMLFQGAALFDSLSVGENVAFRQIQERRMSSAEIKRLVEEKLDLVGLRNVAHLKPAALSGGMQKRVGLARAIAGDPEIILYDEPTTGLDPITADQINNLIIRLQEVLSVSSIAVTHDMVSAYKIADSISMLYDGAIIETKTPHEMQKTKNPYVRQFIRGEADGPITRSPAALRSNNAED